MIPTRIYKKGEKAALNEVGTLFLHEVECSCFWKHCYFTLITERTIESFTKTRQEFGRRIFISSGYRCFKRNDILEGSSEISNHCSGDALDLVPLEGTLDDLEAIASMNFKKVIRYDTFIHCDNRLNKE